MSGFGVHEAALALPIVREQIAHERGCLRSYEDVVRHERSKEPVRHDEIARLMDGRQPHWDRLQRLCRREDELVAVIVGEVAA